MNKPKIQVMEAEPKTGENASGSGYKVFNRIIDWITNDRMQLLNITERINEIVRKSGVRDGLVHLQSLHTTSAVFLNEWQDALLHDVKKFFEQVVEPGQYYRHNDPEFSDCERKNATRTCVACSWARRFACKCEMPACCSARGRTSSLRSSMVHEAGPWLSRFPVSEGCRDSSLFSKQNDSFLKWNRLFEMPSLRSPVMSRPRRKCRISHGAS